MAIKQMLGVCVALVVSVVATEASALHLICGPQAVDPEAGSWTLKGRTYTWTDEVSKGKYLRHFRRWKIDKDSLKYEVFSFAEVLDGKSEPGLLGTYRGTCRKDDTHAKAEAERQQFAKQQQQDFDTYKKRQSPEATSPGQVIRDCSNCPEMVVVPAGSFTMGSPESEPQRDTDEAQVPVTIAQPFAVGRFAVTRGEFAAFIKHSGHKADGGCSKWVVVEWSWHSDLSWQSAGFEQTDRHPVVCVNWDDAKAYVAWLSQNTGRSYRLLSEAEREYVTRAGTTTPFWWGSSISTEQANYQGTADPYLGGGSKGEFRERTLPVDSFKANPWNLHQLHGNVLEWTEDCSSDSNNGNPGNGSPRTAGDCTTHVARGGSWVSQPQDLRAASRVAPKTGYRVNYLGFRIARTL